MGLKIAPTSEDSFIKIIGFHMYEVLAVVPDTQSTLCYYYCYHCSEQKPILQAKENPHLFVMSSEKSENYRNRDQILPSSLY